nr:MAG TPA: hypothetical protein [Caudoviricetes sp.]
MSFQVILFLVVALIQSFYPFILPLSRHILKIFLLFALTKAFCSSIVKS